MSKSIYSLVLNDQLVSMLDKVAYKRGLSRSNMINTILAEYLSFETPEKRFENIFKCMETLVEQTQSLKFVSQQSPNLAAICSAISFRYNPTVRYGIELFAYDGGVKMELKVSLRSTNAKLLFEINNFYWLFLALEEKYLGKIDCNIDGGRYLRRFFIEGDDVFDCEIFGNAITDYIKTFDYLLNLYFSNLNFGEKISNIIEIEYLKNLKKDNLLLK